MPVDIQKEKPEQPEDPNKFNLKTHDFNARGKLRGRNTYRLMVRNGESVYERPVGSGNLFYEDNTSAGRVEVKKDAKGRITSKKFYPDAPHIDYKAPITGAEKLEQELLSVQDENAALRAELDALRAEKEQGMSTTRIVGDQVFHEEKKDATKVEQPVEEKGFLAKAVDKVIDSVSPSSKDDPTKAALIEPKSSSTPVDPTSGHAVPKDLTAEQIRAMNIANGDPKVIQGGGTQMPKESTGKAEAPRPGPTPNAVHAKRAAEEPPRTQGTGPTPANVHARRAAEDAKKGQDL